MGLGYQDRVPLNNKIPLNQKGELKLNHKLEPTVPLDNRQVDLDQVDPPLKPKPTKKEPKPDPKFAYHLEGYLGGQCVKLYYVVSNFQNAVEHVAMITIIGLLMARVYYYQPFLPERGRIYFLLIFVVYITKSVLSLFDVIFILCVNHKKRESYIILLSVLTQISFYCFQLLAANHVEWARDRIGIINTIYYGVYILEAILGKCTEPKATQKASLNPKHIRVSGMDYYCYAALAGYTFEYLYLLKVLGALNWNWLYVLYPVSLIFVGLCMQIFVGCFLGIFALGDDGEDAAIAMLFLPLMPVILFSPVMLWVYYLNEFEEKAPMFQRYYILCGLILALIFYIISAIMTVRFRQYIADEKLREAILRSEGFLRQNTPKREISYQRKKTGIDATFEKVSQKLQSWNLTGNFFKQQDTGVEALSRRTEYDRRVQRKRMILASRNDKPRLGKRARKKDSAKERERQRQLELEYERAREKKREWKRERERARAKEREKQKIREERRAYLRSLQRQKEEKKQIEIERKMQKEEEEVDEEEQELCAICFKRKPNTLYMPCMHGGFCAQCSLEIFQKNRRCPLCQKKLDRIVVMENVGGKAVKKFDIM